MVQTVITVIFLLSLTLTASPVLGEEPNADESGTSPAEPQPAPAVDEESEETPDPAMASPSVEEQVNANDPGDTVVAPDVDLKEVAPDPAANPSSGTASQEGHDTAKEAEAQKSDPTTDVKDIPSKDAPSPGDQTASGATAPKTASPKSDAPEDGSGLMPEDGKTSLVMIENPEPIPEAESLVMLGAEVRPGTSTRLTWTPDTSMAGLTTPTPVLVLNGTEPGPNLCLTAAVHGDELNGIEIVRRVMYTIDPENLSGRVIGVPIVNVQGFRRGSRYLADRRDLNRYFPGNPEGSLASRIAHSLFTDVVSHCDMLVDIHTGSLKRTNLPQMRADMHRPEVAEFSRGFDEMAVVHSSGSEGMLRTAASEAGITAITMEAGESLRIQEHQIDAGVNAINSLLEKQNMLSRLFVWGDPEPVYYDSSWVRADHGGILNSQVSLGARVTEGQVLGTVTDPITNAQHSIKADEDGRIIGMAVDQFVMAGFAAYHLGTQARAPEVGE